MLLPTTKREVATKLNLTQETFSRVLREMAKAGIIAVRGRMIQVRDAERIQAMNSAPQPNQAE